jgi:hypothetical protein
MIGDGIHPLIQRAVQLRHNTLLPFLTHKAQHDLASVDGVLRSNHQHAGPKQRHVHLERTHDRAQSEC